MVETDKYIAKKVILCIIILYTLLKEVFIWTALISLLSIYCKK